jgi:uncharacterized membrane protein
VQIHVATVLPAFLLGTWQIFASMKGAHPHRVAGYIYLALMTVTSLTALFIHEVMPDAPFGFSPIHLLIPVTLLGIFGAIYGARTHRVTLHKYAMIGTYVGGILVAGAFTFVPGRILHAVFFDS